MLRILFKGSSYLFHPLLMLTYILLSLLWMAPDSFRTSNPHFIGILVISVFSTTFLMPGLAVLLMKFMNLIPSLEMPDKRNRIGPLIVASIFHLWIFKNILDNPEVPKAFVAFTLGSVVTLFICFFINLFKKISLHSAGLGGWLVAVLFTTFYMDHISLSLGTSEGGEWIVHPLLFVVLLILFAGWTASGRLYLKAHSQDEIWGGFFAGFAGQAFAYMYIF